MVAAAEFVAMAASAAVGVARQKVVAGVAAGVVRQKVVAWAEEARKQSPPFRRGRQPQQGPRAQPIRRAGRERPNSIARRSPVVFVQEEVCRRR